MKTQAKVKPYPDFPLTAHPSGQWCKKIRGKLHYFGTEADAALNKYLEERDDLQAGKVPRKKSEGLTLGHLVNRFLTTKQRFVDTGELAAVTWRDYYDVCERLLEAFGASRQVLDLAGEDFERLRSKIAKTRGPVGLGTSIQRIRTVFKFAFDENLIDRPVRFGSTFRKPSRKTVRKDRSARGPKMFEPGEIHRILAAAKQPMRAMVLLGVNSGFGQSDIANLPLSALDLKNGWVSFPRPKTGINRRCHLWPETVEALREAIATRPAAKDEADAGLAFITKYGRKFVRVREREKGGCVPIDSVGLEFGKLLVKLGIKRHGLSFYGLRHSFRTAADVCKDSPAIDHVMGHTSESMASHYRERIDDDRLKAVSDVVRIWLFASDATANDGERATLPFRTAAG